MQKIISAVSAILMLGLLLTIVLNSMGKINLNPKTELVPIVISIVVVYLILFGISKSLK